jgi:hypothetical protein
MLLLICLLVTTLPALDPPYSASNVIEKITFAPKSSIVQKAAGSDNWAVTWGDDGALYTAYGDGWGFEPKVSSKLSLGYAKVTGAGDNYSGINIRSSTGEKTGDGRSGLKASGFIMVNKVIYMLCRNADNTYMAWSDDYMKTWHWEWQFTSKFGFATFLNFGKNNADARDNYVYVYGSDAEDAYAIYDHIILARVHKDSILTRAAYRYFSGTPSNPAWTSNLSNYKPVFTFAGKGTRFSASYNAGIGRYLFNQIHSKLDSRFSGGFGIYDAPEPWGPFTTAFFVTSWDMGPGECNAIPTKWLSSDGKSGFLVSSTDDKFTTRGFTITTFPTVNLGLNSELPAGRQGIEVYPNPFRTSAEIRVLMPNAECGMMNVNVDIYDISGRLIWAVGRGGVLTKKANNLRTPPLQHQFRIPHSAFHNSYTWDARNQSNGTYLVTARAGNTVYTKKAVLAR